MRDGFPRAPSGSPGRIGVAVSVGDGEQGFSASDMGSRFSLRATDAHKPESRSWSVSFRRGSFWRRLIGKPPGEVEELAAYSTFARIATSMSNDPLELRSSSSAHALSWRGSWRRPGSQAIPSEWGHLIMLL